MSTSPSDDDNATRGHSTGSITSMGGQFFHDGTHKVLETSQRALRKAKEVTDTATQLAGLVLLAVNHASSSTMLEAHETLVTKSGRLKMLHAKEEQVLKAWKSSSEIRVLNVEKASQYEYEAPANIDTRASKRVDRSVAGQPTTAVEFDASEISCSECAENGRFPVWFRRTGNRSGRVKVSWEVRNGNIDAKYFSQIVDLKGSVEFEDGEEWKSVVFPLVRDPTWSIEAFYQVRIVPDTFETSDSEVVPIIGRNGSIKLRHLNEERFPANVKPGASQSKILRSFFVHNFTEMPREAFYGILLVLYPAVDYYLFITLLKTLVDCGLAETPEKEAINCPVLTDYVTGNSLVILLLGSMVALFAIDHLRETLYRRLRLGGKAKKQLRLNMYVQMLQISAEARDDYDQGDMPKLIDTVVDDAINDCWLSTFKMIGMVANVILKVVLLIQVGADAVGVTRGILLAAGPTMVAMMLFLEWLTETREIALSMRVIQAAENWFAYISMSESCHSVIKGYHQSDVAAANADKLHGLINKNNCAAVDYSAFNIRVLRWGYSFVYVLSLAIAIAAIRGGNGTIGVGDFVLLEKTLRDFSKTLVVSNLLQKQIMRGVGHVNKISAFLNKDTVRELKWKRLDSALFSTTQHPSESHNGADISLRGVQYSYSLEMGCPKLAIPPVSVNMNAGQLICWPRLDEEHPVGINTLFKVMSGLLSPEAGYVGVPKRWRVVYIPLQPVLFDGTLMYNLAFGRTDVNGLDHSEDLVWQICRAVGMSADLIGDAYYDVGTNGERLKTSDRLCVSLVRALLHDVDLLLISSALDVLGQARGQMVLKYLKDYIRECGPPGQTYKLPRNLRHRKTVLYTTKLPDLWSDELCDSKVIGGVLDQPADSHEVLV
eukprot:TRINITY_DN7709_c0_g1_i5.p1 TRINITY_DN7709_c0_g1~~TRINITY_DN7709_c0_g1_i5.p1  ORF type:complete len:886 (-),score=100.22 TRINITY_DN7709_c0_g1_i5:275-2932(-)